MRNGLILLGFLILAVAVGMPLLHGVLGLLGGLIIAPLAVIGSLLLAGFILFLVFSGVGVIGLAVLGLVGGILFVVLLPLLLPVLIFVLPVVLLVKLVRS